MRSSEKDYENNRREFVLNLTCYSVILIRDSIIINFTTAFFSFTLWLIFIFLKFSGDLILNILVPIAFSRAFAFI